MSLAINSCKGRVFVRAARLPLLLDTLRTALDPYYFGDQDLSAVSEINDLLGVFSWVGHYDDHDNLIYLSYWSSGWEERDAQLIEVVARYATSGFLRLSTLYWGERAYAFDGKGHFEELRGVAVYGAWKQSLATCVYLLTHPASSSEVEQAVANATAILAMNPEDEEPA